jgi:hypothetical protein
VPGGDLGELGVPARALLGRAADDQRGPRLVDEDRVDLVHDGVGMAALDALLQAPGHVVAQVVETELVVGAVGDVGGVLLAALLRGHLGEDDADLQAEEAVHPAHPLGVALGQVVVDRDDVHALAGQRVEVGGQGGHQGLALTGAHLGDVPAVQRGTAHDLDVEMPLAQGPLGRLTDGCEGLGKHVVEGFSVGQALTELGGHRPQFLVAQRSEVFLDRIDLVSDPPQLAQDLALARAQDPIDDDWHFSSRSLRIRWR